MGDRGLDGLLDSAADDHRIGTERDAAEPLVVDRAGQNRGGRRAVAGDVAGLRGDLVDELGPHVLVGIFQLDLFADGHAVLGDERIAEALIDDHIASGRTHRDGHRVGQDFDAALQLDPRPVVEQKLLRHL